MTRHRLAVVLLTVLAVALGVLAALLTDTPTVEW